MPQVIPSRMTHNHDGELVVFLIGMRINKAWRPDLWLPVFAAMPGMLAELSRDPDSGLLGYRWSSTHEVPGWSSTGARTRSSTRTRAASEASHRPAWTRFNQTARKAPGAVGIWHETFVVDRAESIYVGMPAGGLARRPGSCRSAVEATVRHSGWPAAPIGPRPDPPLSCVP